MDDDIEQRRDRVAEARVLFNAGQISLSELHRVLTEATNLEGSVGPLGEDSDPR